MCVRKYSHVINQALRGICTCRITIRPHLGHLAVNTVATSHSRLVFAVPNSHDLMGHAERLHQNRSREGQEAHAPFYVQYEVIEKTFQQSQHADASVFTDMIKGEIEKVNSHVVACLGVLESASPASDTELVRCSAECGSLVAFIHCNGKGLREIVKKFEEEEKMRSTTWECCTRVSMRMIETAPFCTSLLERLLNVQAGLEESVHGSLRRLLTEAYEASAGLSGNESPSVRGTPKAPAAPRMPSMPTPGQAFYVPRLPSASSRRQRVHRPRVTDLPAVEIPPIECREFSNQVAGPLFIRNVSDYS